MNTNLSPTPTLSSSSTDDITPSPISPSLTRSKKIMKLKIKPISSAEKGKNKRIDDNDIADMELDLE